MRPIKFRAWDVPRSFWLSSDDGFFHDFIESDTDGNLYFNTPDTVICEQFTGLLDNNGKEIYEGDICRWSEKNGVVVYHKAMFFLSVKGLIDINLNWPNIEVIGNIHENPELLA